MIWASTSRLVCEPPALLRVNCGMRNQYESTETTSPWAMEPSAQTACWLVLSLRNLTEPSSMSTFAPPG